MKWMVAPSYANATIKKVNEDTHKAYIEDTCDRCGGCGIIVARVENGQPIPIPVDGGVCYKCNGTGKVQKWVKAYTEKEMESYLKSRETYKARARRAEQERKDALFNKSEENRKTHLAELGYDPENPVVYIVAGGNTYAIKDQLKEAGCRFEYVLGWYSASPIEVPAPYFLLPIAFDEVFNWYPLTLKIGLKEKAKQVVDAAIDAVTPESESEYMGEEKERLRNLDVTLSAVHTTDGFYGTTFIYTFIMDKNILVWMTSACKDLEVGEKYSLTGTVKCHKEYKKQKQTYLSRCIVKEKES